MVFGLKEYDLIAIGSGSALAVVSAMMQDNPNMKIAVIDKDEPGGICLTRGCIPSKILLYPAELIRNVERAGFFGIDVKVDHVNFIKVMERMRRLIGGEIDAIREGLSPGNLRDVDLARFAAAGLAAFSASVAARQLYPDPPWSAHCRRFGHGH